MIFTVRELFDILISNGADPKSKNHDGEDYQDLYKRISQIKQAYFSDKPIIKF